VGMLLARASRIEPADQQQNCEVIFGRPGKGRLLRGK
jgi:hypothetical protein